MAKSTILGVDQMKNKVRLSLAGITRSRSMLETLGKISRQRIYQQTKTGYGIAGKTKQKLTRLSSWYMAYRERYQEQAPTGEFFSPRRSNLTLSGQMLDALTYVIDQARGKVTVLVASTQRAIYYPLKRRRGEPPEQLTNAQVAERVASRGRPFIGLDEQARERLRSEIRKEIRRVLRREALRR